MREPRWFRIARVVVLTLLGLFAVAPVYVMLTASLKPLPDVEGAFRWIPSHLTVSPFSAMWTTIPLLTYLENSLIVCSIAAVASVLVALFASYAISRYRFRGRQVFSITILSTQMFPGILFLLPLFVIFVNIGNVTGINLYGTRTGLIITYMTFTLPFAIWMLAAYLDTIPRELDEAATVDGTGPLGAFFRVVIPAAVPGIVAVFIYAFMTAWSEMLFASVLTNDSTRTLAVGLQGYATQNQVYWNQIMAASLTVSVPIVVGFLLLQRFLVAGMTAGSVKSAGRSARLLRGGLGGELVEDGRQPLQFVQVRGGQPVQPAGAVRGEPDPGDPAVAVVAPPLDQPGRFGPVDQLDRAVRPEQQVFGQVADGGRVGAGMALDGQQQLVLRRGEADLPGPRLRPAQEAAQPGAEGEQVLVILAGQPIHVRHRPGLPAGPVPASALPAQLNASWPGPACWARGPRGPGTARRAHLVPSGPRPGWSVGPPPLAWSSGAVRGRGSGGTRAKPGSGGSGEAGRNGTGSGGSGEAGRNGTGSGGSGEWPRLVRSGGSGEWPRLVRSGGSGETRGMADMVSSSASPGEAGQRLGGPPGPAAADGGRLGRPDHPGRPDQPGQRGPGPAQPARPAGQLLMARHRLAVGGLAEDVELRRQGRVGAAERRSRPVQQQSLVAGQAHRLPRQDRPGGAG